MPHHYPVEGCRVQPQHSDEIPSDGFPHQRGVRRVPRQQYLQRHAQHVQWMPYGRLQQADQQSQPRCGRLPNGLLAVPHHYPVEGCGVQSQYSDEIPTDRFPHQRGVRRLPRQQYLQRHAQHVQWMPYGRLQQADQQSEPRGCRFPHGLLHLPYHHAVEGRQV